MKIQLHLKNNKVLAWNTGGVSADVCEKDGILLDKKVLEISDEDWDKIQQGYVPVVINDVFSVQKSAILIQEETKKKEKQILKDKFAGGNFNNQDIQELAKMIL